MTAKSTTSTASQACGYCNVDFPLDRTECPHCAQPMLFPNVTMARQVAETQKLEKRFNEALRDADSRGCRAAVDQFTADCAKSSAILRCNLERLHRQVASGSEIFAPYYDIERLRLRMNPADGLNFEKLRPQAEIELLGNAKHAERLHYACLSLNDKGLTSYGDCIIKLSEPMIAHRASCFEGNTAVIYAVEHDFTAFVRSDWGNRHMICTAVMASQLECTTPQTDFPGILAAPDPNNQSENDLFIEVHVFGDMTAFTFESVEFVTAAQNKGDHVYRRATTEKLEAAGVTVTVG